VSEVEVEVEAEVEAEAEESKSRYGGRRCRWRFRLISWRRQWRQSVWLIWRCEINRWQTRFRESLGCRRLFDVRGNWLDCICRKQRKFLRSSRFTARSCRNRLAFEACDSLSGHIADFWFRIVDYDLKMLDLFLCRHTGNLQKLLDRLHANF